MMTRIRTQIAALLVLTVSPAAFAAEAKITSPRERTMRRLPPSPGHSRANRNTVGNHPMRKTRYSQDRARPGKAIPVARLGAR